MRAVRRYPVPLADVVVPAGAELRARSAPMVRPLFPLRMVALSEYTNRLVRWLEHFGMVNPPRVDAWLDLPVYGQPLVVGSTAGVGVRNLSRFKVRFAATLLCETES